VFDLVVGDIVVINVGEQLPADCVLISGSDVTTDESNLTGEPEHVNKECLTEANMNSNPNCFMLAQSLVMSGKGSAMVAAVGVNTQQGKAEEKMNIEDEQTPLQNKLETIADTIGKIGMYCALLTFTCMCINLLVTCAINGTAVFSVTSLSKVVDFFLIAVTVVVVAVPEGLPLAVTISLAYSVLKMKDEQNLVRKLEASETMGGADEICTDKTGTLTQNKMTLRQIYIQECD